MRILLSFLLCASLSFMACAQEHKGVIQGTLIDSATAKPIAFATVSIFKASDTTLVSYRLSDEKGEFKVTQLPTDLNLRIIITFTGYPIYRKPIAFSPGQPLVNLGQLLLNTTVVNLNEVIIRAERPPVVVRKDTIEFNATAFKTLPDALVEDLLRKLPGVSVDRDGNILVNGRRVSTIYVDGKEFFGGDVRIASKNLPANTIDKVQVTNDKEALRFNPFIPEAEIPQVINLKLKPGIKKGVFGKVYAGTGPNRKAEAGALLNLFRDTTQLSILGYGNNLNKASFSFSDIRSVGGFGRSGWGNANGNGVGGLSIDRVSFGGWGNGLLDSWGGGINYNTVIAKKIPYSFNYFYGAVNSDYDELRTIRQQYNDTTLTTRQQTDQQINQFAHLIGTKVAFDVSPRLKIEFRPQLVLVRENMNQFYDITSTSNKKGLINTSDNDQRNRNRGTMFTSWLRIMPTFKKKGRNLDLTHYVLVDDSRNQLYNLAQNAFYLPPNQQVLDQLRKNDIKIINSNVYLRYTDLLSEQLTFSSAATISGFYNENDLRTFFPDSFQEYVIGIPALTGNFSRQGLKADANAALRWKYKKWTIGPGLGFGSFDSKNTFSQSTTVNQHIRVFMPSFDLGYGVFNFNYNRNFREPSLANIQPVINNTNPLFIRTGNPNLKPAINNALSLSLRKYDTKRLLTYNASINGSWTKDATIISRTVDGAGVQTTIPTNTDDTWQAGNSLSFQKDWKMANNRQISLIASNTATQARSFVMLNQVRSPFTLVNIRPSAELRINLNDKFELSHAHTFSHYKSRYESAQFSSQLLNVHDSRSEVILRLGKHIVAETQLDYRFNPNTAPGLLTSYYKWNAALTYVFLSGNRGQLKFAVNDILDQNVLAQRSVRENLIEDLQGSTIRRYGLVTFTYNIRNFGDKIGGRNQLFRF